MFQSVSNLWANHSQLMHNLRENFKIGMMHILREKMCKIGRLMLNFSTANAETLDVIPLERLKDVNL